MRNVVTHDYAGVNLKVMWGGATVDVPEVCAVLETFFTCQQRS